MIILIFLSIQSVLAMSETFVTLPVVRELLTTQERTYKAMIEVFLESIKNEVKEVRQGVTDLKESLLFTQKDFDEAKVKIERFGFKLNKVEDDVDTVYEDIDYLYDELENIENQSRRNNIKVFGIPEKDEKKGPELWEECEEVVKSEIESKLNMECGDDVIIERAHRVGKRHAPIRHLPDGTTVKVRPRPIIAKFLSWKDKEKIVKAARKIKPKQVQFLEDFSQRTLDKRKAMVPELTAARKSGKRAFLVMDQVVYRNTRPPDDHNLNHGKPNGL